MNAGSAAPPNTGSAAPPNTGSATTPPPNTGSATTPPPNTGSAAKSGMAVIVIDSSPPNAEVFGANGASFGKTPVRVTLPISDLPQQFELRLSGYKKKQKQIVVTGNAVVDVPLDRAPASTGGGHSHKSSGHKGSDNGLMSPDDL